MIIKDNKELKQCDFENEKILQTFFENNVDKILKYKFIDTEFPVGDFRIDSLCFDEETKSFKIIEFKNIKNHSLVDQGYTYLKLLLERKADFVLQYNIKTNSRLTIKDIDWSQSRIIFVSPVYTAYQLNATNFKDVPIDLYKITKYESNIVEITHITKSSSVKISEIKLQETQKIVDKEIKVYTDEDHLKTVSDKVKDLYENLKVQILELDDVDIEVKKYYIAFKGKTNICDVELHKNNLKLYINMKKGTLKDPLKIAEDTSNVGHWGNGDYRVKITSDDDIDIAMSLVKQSLTVNKK